MNASATFMNPTYANANRIFASLGASMFGGHCDVQAGLSGASSAMSSYLLGEIAEGWELVQPLPVSSEWDGDLCIMSDALFSVYGDGDTEVSARQDYVTSLIEYYELIEDRANDVFTRALFQKLQRYLRHV